MFDYNAHEEMMAEMGAELGDPRRCPIHPHVKTSSPDGMFDAPCHICEGEMEEAAEMWDMDPENAHRKVCAFMPWFPATPYIGAKCTDLVCPDDILF